LCLVLLPVDAALRLALDADQQTGLVLGLRVTDPELTLPVSLFELLSGLSLRLLVSDPSLELFLDAGHDAELTLRLLVVLADLNLFAQLTQCVVRPVLSLLVAGAHLALVPDFDDDDVHAPRLGVCGAALELARLLINEIGAVALQLPVVLAGLPLGLGLHEGSGLSRPLTVSGTGLVLLIRLDQKHLVA